MCWIMFLLAGCMLTAFVICVSKNLDAFVCVRLVMYGVGAFYNSLLSILPITQRFIL